MSAPDQDLAQYCRTVAENAHKASAQLQLVSGELKNRWLNESAQALRAGVPAILAANANDIEAAPGYGLTDAQIDRLVLNEERIDGIATALEQISMLPDPIGQTIEGSVRPNGLEINKVRVPLGVVFFIYESRPNVTADAAAICLKSGNAVILRGGKEAAHSSRAIVDILMKVATAVGIPENAVQLVSTTDRAAVGHFLTQDDYIDVAIPRGGEGLIRRVSAEATMPVIKHFDGNCHVYIDQEACLEMATQIVVNSKCQRMGVCNACESLVVHREIAAEAIPQVVGALIDQGITIHGDELTCQLIESAVPATEDDFGTEYLGPGISVKVVDDVDSAIEHINRYSSHHTEAIVTSNIVTARRFVAAIDSSAVMINASTRFNDGGEFGLGAEIGISTDKFHARGPCGLEELTSYKYIVTGNGQIRG
ncbi:MAG: glutamate-5-semialdehyde dehydrogenase [Rhodopirellula sp.]|nr:glutamate-5-semialdehyde dehydrogenase [Rhodopirellula sp.]|tara:strand:+ start:13368 stop:14639 length:1272 start_codon:yes stop_codon:yes gene_type:complete